MRTLAAAVLTAEGLVLFFATLVAKDLSDVAGGTVWAVGGAGALSALLLAGLLRHRWAYIAGSALQPLVIAAGFVVPVMFFLGTLFTALWFTALRLGAKAERLTAARRSPPPPTVP